MRGVWGLPILHGRSGAGDTASTSRQPSGPKEDPDCPPPSGRCSHGSPAHPSHPSIPHRAGAPVPRTSSRSACHGEPAQRREGPRAARPRPRRPDVPTGLAGRPVARPAAPEPAPGGAGGGGGRLRLALRGARLVSSGSWPARSGAAALREAGGPLCDREPATEETDQELRRSALSPQPVRKTLGGNQYTSTLPNSIAAGQAPRGGEAVGQRGPHSSSASTSRPAYCTHRDPRVQP